MDDLFYISINLKNSNILKDNNDVCARQVEAQKQDIREQARKRDEYVNYQQDMDATLQRNEQVYSVRNYKIAKLCFLVEKT